MVAYGLDLAKPNLGLVFCGLVKGVITSKIKHAIKHKTSPARLAQLLHFVLACSQ